MKRLWNWLMTPATQGAYWDGVEAGMGLGERFERDRVSDVIRDLFVDLPDKTFTVSRPVELGEYLIDEIEGRNDS